MVATNNVFGFDWYGRDFELAKSNTEYTTFLLNGAKALELAGSNPLANEVATSWFLTKVVAPITMGAAPVYINTKSDDSYTDGKKIMVSSLSKWNAPERNAYHRLDTYIGLGIHEACHVAFTNFNVLKKNALSESERWLLNVIEDEAIEQTLSFRSPGYKKFLKVVKAEILGTDIKMTGDDKQDVFNLFFGMVRIPNFYKSVSRETIEKYGDLFAKIYEVLSKNKCLITTANDYNDTANNAIAAIEICDLIAEFLGASDEEMDETEKPESSPENYDGSESGEESEQESEQESGDESEQESGDESGEESDGKGKTDDELQDILDELEKEIGDAFDSMDSNELNELSNIAKTLVPCNLGDEIKKGEKKDAANFKKYLSNTTKYVANLKRALAVNGVKYETKTTRFSISGQLDSSIIASAFIGNKFSNKRMETKKVKSNKKLAVVLSVDMSGSMYTGGCASNAGEMTTLFAEAISNLEGCELYVYTHEENVQCLVNNDYNKSKQFIGSICTENANGSQDEVNAYTKIVEDVRSKTKLPVCLINFTDSEYCCYHENIKKCISNLKRDKVQTTLVALNEKKADKYNEAIYGKDNYVSVPNIKPIYVKQMTKDIARIIKKMYK